MAWGGVNNDSAGAWQLMKKIDAPSLGLSVDAFHICVRQRSVNDLAGIPVEKIFLVQLSDRAQLPAKGSLVETARHHRLLPGDGNFPLATLLHHLQQINYRGPLGLEVFNDELHQADPVETARRAMHALNQLLKSQ